MFLFSACRALPVLLLLCAWPFVCQASNLVDQGIYLQKGWNAVYLEVQPTEDDPSAIFSGTPVEMCAVWIPSKARVESLSDSEAIPEKHSDWSVWHPEDHPAAFLNNLFALQGGRAMLVKSSAPATVVVSGTPVFQRIEWLAPSFNLVGFDVDANAPPTFARFFEGSRAHAGLKIFKLSNSEWKKIAPGETIQRGQAYWVWCAQGSDFQGPLDCTVPLAGQTSLVLPNGGAPVRIAAQSRGSLPVNLTIEAEGALPLRFSTGGEFRDLGSEQLSLSSDGKRSFRLGRKLDSASDSASAIVHLRGGGMHYRLPVSGNPN